MTYFQPLVLLIILFLLTALLCWGVTGLLVLNPLCSIGLLLLGSMGVVLCLDVLGEFLFPR